MSPKLDLETIDGLPHTCGKCGKVLLRDADGLFCLCPRWRVQFVGGPMDGVRDRYLWAVASPPKRTLDGYELQPVTSDLYVYEYVGTES